MLENSDMKGEGEDRVEFGEEMRGGMERNEEEKRREEKRWDEDM